MESIPIEVEERVAVVEEIKLIKEEYGPDDYDTIDRKRKIGTGLFDKLTSFENLLRNHIRNNKFSVTKDSSFY